jgi:HK97 family phage major capsid protein
MTVRSKELESEALAKLEEAKSLANGEEGPKPEDEERFNALVDEGMALYQKSQGAATAEEKVKGLSDFLARASRPVGGAPIPFSTQEIAADDHSGKSLGQIFVESEAYAELKESGALASDRAAFKSAPVNVGRKATTTVVSATGTQASGLVTPDYLPGTQGDLVQRQLTVRDLFGQGTTDSDTISYARLNAVESGASFVTEATAVNGANADAGLKPQSSLNWQRVESPVESVATWIATTRRALADAGQIRALIDNQLRIMLGLEVEDQLLNGDGTSPELDGILNITGHQTLSAATAGIINPDAIRRAKRLVRTAGARVPADGLIIHPEDAEAFDTMKDGMGRYLFADPTSNAEPTPWGLRRVESEAVSAGTAVIGAFNVGATVFQREPITILTADQHADFFVRNLIVVLAEERLGFAVYYPASFVELTFQEWDAEAS